MNVVNLGFLGAIGGYALYRILLRFVPRTGRGVTIAGGLAAFLSVPLAAAGFVAQFAVGGTADVAIETIATAMIGAHVLIGIGEGILTGIVLGAVVRSRPDLVYGAPAYAGQRTEELV